MDKDRLIDLVEQLAGRKVLVIGDVFLDQYLVGRATRLSREAPVPILEYDREFTLPGAAANPANNIQALGAKALIVGVIGEDRPGEILKRELLKAGIDVSGIIVDSTRPTTTKTRLIAEDGTRIRQQIVRIDRLDRRELEAKVRQRALDYTATAIPSVDAVLFSDYKTGLVSQELIDTCLKMARDCGKLVTADSQGNILKFRGLSLVKCNQTEAEAHLSKNISSEDDFHDAAELLLHQLGAQSVVITRGWDGMSMADASGYAHIPVSNRSEVFDVTGAGDTVIAVLTLALAAGATLLEAADLSNIAAGIVVRRLGNATITPAELQYAIGSYAG